MIAIGAAAVVAMGAHGQAVYGPPLPSATGTTPVVQPKAGVLKSPSTINPLEILDSVGQQPPSQGRGTGAEAGAGQGMGGLSPAINILVLLTVISLAPSIMLMTTCFVRITIVLGLLKQAIGTASVPPPQVTVALAMFMTMLVMAPTAQRVYDQAVVPYQQGKVNGYDDLWNRGKQPIRDFMFAQIETTGNWSSLYMVLDYRGINTSQPENLTRADVDMVSLIPAFMLSELKTAFLLGFRVYLPFLIIDIVISSLLISMSMMMLPPVLVSLPFKILLFVLVDGWTLVVGSLMHGFTQPVYEPVAMLIGSEAAQGLIGVLS
jgi:flagellar biosynthetic protein FliP